MRCPACRTTQAIDLRTLDRHPWSAISSLIPALSCRSCRPHAPFAELVRLSDKSVADDLHEQHTRRALGDERRLRRWRRLRYSPQFSDLVVIAGTPDIARTL